MATNKENLQAAIEFERLSILLQNKGEFTAEEHLWYRDELLKKWEASKLQLETAKANEMDQRKAFVAFAFDPDKQSGTERIELENGYQAKAVKKLNYNVNQDTVNDALDKIENLDAQGKFIAERLIKWKAELSLTEYNQLEAKYKVIIDQVISTSEGAPSLEIVAPKNQKKR